MKKTAIYSAIFLVGLIAGNKVIPHNFGSCTEGVTVTGPAMLIPLVPDNSKEMREFPPKPLPGAKDIFNYEPEGNGGDYSSEAQSANEIIE